MADDHTLRSNRGNDPYRRAAEPARPSEHASGTDPLAELARLIGQNDPFADFGRNNPRGAQQADYPSPSTAPDWQHAPAPEQHAAAASPRYPSRDIYAASEDYAHPIAPHEAQAGGRYADGLHAESPRHHPHPEADDQSRRFEAETYADDQDHDHAYGDEGDHYYEDEAEIEPHEDEMYDDAPRARHRSGLVTALALIGCAMMGVGGAYGYRSYQALPVSKEAAPVITADNTTPTKIIPAAPSDPQSGKQINERFANAATKEQIVTRQEEPVAVREPGTNSAPRVVLPSPVAPAPQGAAPTQPSGSAPAAGGDTKKVRTVTIRPDGTDTNGRPVGAPSNGAQGAGSPAATRTTPPAPRAPARNGNAPLSLDPQGQTEAPAPRVRTAVTPPAPRATAPESAYNSTGGYLVQIASQKTESEAQASFRSLQAKFPGELGSRQPVIRRADLGTKGVVYRTMIGPFGSSQEASQFCANYRAAGGQCLIPSN